MVALNTFALKVAGVGNKNEVINLYSNQQRRAVGRLDAILSCSQRSPKPSSAPITCPLLLPWLRFMMSLSLLKSSGLFYLLRMCWALKVKPRCLWPPDCLSVLCVCFSVAASPIKAQLPSAFWEIAAARRPPANCLILMLPVEATQGESARTRAHVSCATECCWISSTSLPR